MRYKPVARGEGAFQEGVTSAQVQAMIARAFGPGAVAVEAVELSGGMFNTTLRVDGEGFGGPVIVRVAPRPRLQARSERDLMRTEHAVCPFLAPIAHLVPRILFADFTRQVLPRDFLVQTVLPGMPAPEALAAWQKEALPGFYRQLGEIAKAVHAVAGDGMFGRPGVWEAPVWSTAIAAELTDIAADVERAGLDASDIRQALAVCQTHADVLDEITRPHLTVGDLWVPNVMVDPAAPSPTICGVFDTDRALWGDPAADWANFQATLKPGTPAEAFWETYGRPADDPDARWRTAVYQVRHWGAIRLERNRRGLAGKIGATYEAVAALLVQLAAR